MAIPMPNYPGYTYMHYPSTYQQVPFQTPYLIPVSYSPMSIGSSYASSYDPHVLPQFSMLPPSTRMNYTGYRYDQASAPVEFDRYVDSDSENYTNGYTVSVNSPTVQNPRHYDPQHQFGTYYSYNSQSSCHPSCYDNTGPSKSVLYTSNSLDSLGPLSEPSSTRSSFTYPGGYEFSPDSFCSGRNNNFFSQGNISSAGSKVGMTH